ncbi:MAG: PAS domain S-box protein [Alphaproteobacteria bacterium]|nr:PAS domain S-box protein [Alphaproteobacteria bacterium]
MADVDRTAAPAGGIRREVASNAAMPAPEAAPGSGVVGLDQIIDAVPTAMVVISADGIIHTLNGTAELLFGDSRAGLAGRPAETLVPARYRSPQSSVWSAPSTLAGQLFGLAKNGRTFPIEVTSHPIEIGSVRFLLCSILDMSTRRQREEAARRSEALFTALLRASPNMISLTTMAEGRYVDVNDGFLRVLGRQRSDVIGRTSDEIGFWNDRSLRQRMIENLRRDGFVRGLETKVRTSSGALRDFIYAVDVVPHEGQELLLGIGQDITDLRATEAQLRHVQSLEAIGKLTGGVAHDFNNLLAIIHGNLELLDEAVAEGSPLKPLVQDARRAAKRGASLTHQLLAFSRQQPLSPEIVDIGELILEMSELLERTLGEGIAIRCDVTADLWPARIDPNQLANAILNLAVNARDAMPGGGRLTIEASNTVLERDYAERHSEVRPGPYVLVALTDTGTGMPKDVMERALEPFFTTKEVGQGSGLGLSMVYGFAKQSGGHLKLYSEPGQGTTVRLYLPKSESGVSGGEGSLTTPDPRREPAPLPEHAGGEAILVVEDDPMVRALTVRILTGLGYRTSEAQDAVAASSVLDTVGPVDLLLTDVVLPHGVSGPELARQAQARWPALQVLYMSGYTRNAIIHNGVLDQGVSLLTKPFLKQELALAVRDCLDRGRKP